MVSDTVYCMEQMRIRRLFWERRIARLRREVVAPAGSVRGWHERCPAGRVGFLGTYALLLDDHGHICCEACGAHNLVPQRGPVYSTRTRTGV